MCTRYFTSGQIVGVRLESTTPCSEGGAVLSVVPDRWTVAVTNFRLALLDSCVPRNTKYMFSVVYWYFIHFVITVLRPPVMGKH